MKHFAAITLTFLAACAVEPEPDDADPEALKNTGHVSGDLDWDGDSDLLFQRRTDYTMKVWSMDGNTHVGNLQTNPVGAVNTGWAVVGTPDLSGDGRPDILFQNESTNRLVSWWLVDLERIWGGFTDPMGPTKPDGSPQTALEARCSYDVNGDETHDIVFQHTGTGRVRAWRMQGMTRLADIVYATPPSDYILLGCADHSGDALADLVFLNSNNEIEIWENDNGWVPHVLGLPPSAPGTDFWRLGAIGDYNGDGHDDLVFQAPWVAQGPNATANTPMLVWYLHYYDYIGEAPIKEPSGGGPSLPGDYWLLVGPK